MALQRRGALAGLAVLMTGLLAKVSELPARAADGEPLLLGRGNRADSGTQLDKSAVADGTALVVTNARGAAIQGLGEGDGPANAGVTGFGSGILGYGVVGQGPGVGVLGQAEGFSATAGVMGSGGRVFGVAGVSTDSPGVFARGSDGLLAIATHSGGNGVVGQGNAGGAGVLGRASQSPNPETYGVFSEGRFGASGPITALIGGTVAFDMASLDSLIVDVGSATLQRGRATVPLAPDFAPLIDTSNYQVFVSPYGPTRGLFVSRRTPTSFEVEATGDNRGESDNDHGSGKRGDDGDRGRDADIAFAYQVVGKRKDVSVSRPAVASVTAQPKASRSPNVPNTPEPLPRPRRGDR
jgi:hypothetical protein